MEVYEVTDFYVAGKARWLQFKLHDRSLLNGSSLLEQIEINSLEEMEIAH